MTTKTKYGEIQFHYEQGPSCCGQMIIADMEEGATVQHAWLTRKIRTFATREEQHKDFLDRVGRRIEEETEGYNDEYDRESDERVDCCYAFVALTLIKGPKEQIPGLIDALKEHGWQIDQEGRNPKTDNTIVMMSKAL